MRIDEFLLARIAEDEAVAHRARGLLVIETAWYDASTLHDVRGFTRADAAHVAAWSPHRVLAECAAKRAIVEQHRPDIGYIVVYDHRDREAAEAEGRETMPVIASVPQNPVCMRALASVYADHPDYRPEWAA